MQGQAGRRWDVFRLISYCSHQWVAFETTENGEAEEGAFAWSIIYHSCFEFHEADLVNGPT